jgi:thioredoxin reductase (NADPH)
MEEVSGENGLTYARYKNTATGEMTEHKSNESFGVFVFAGYAPATDGVKGIVELNEHGYIVTDGSQKTSVDGVYAAGDVCIKPLRQVVTATGDGALAATELEKYVAAMHRKTGLRPEVPSFEKRKASVPASTEASVNATELFTAEMKQQLDAVFSRMERNLLLKLYLDSRPISAELEGFISALVTLSHKLTMEVADKQAPETFAPCVKICLEDGTETGLAFHGVPSGHEFTSFVLGLYNAAGPGQAIDEDILQKIKAISKPTNMKILVTLSCTMCPDLVKAAQRIAVENPLITAQVYDIRHFEQLKNHYNVMSVPCLVVNDEHVSFGKKNIHQILDLLESL